MAAFALRRLGAMALVLFAVSVLVFMIFNVIPNNNPAQQMAGKNATPELVAQIERTWGFDEPLPVQYATMMKNVFSGDLVSYSNHLEVDQRILEGIPATLSLCLGAAVIWLFFGILFGYLSAIRPGGALDRVLTVVALVGISMPAFWLAAVLLFYLTFELRLFPSGGYVPLTESPLEWAHHLILPWITLAVLFIGFYSRVLRANMLEAMDEDHVRAARAKGLPERQVRTRHVLRNALIPVVTLFGLDFAALVGGGTIVTEYIFNIDGVGRYAADAISELDLPPIMGVTLYGAFFVVLFSALVDIAYAYLDPRVRLGEESR